MTVDRPMMNLDLDETGRVIGIEILATRPGERGNKEGAPR
ncbi:DUF2283 domain-containing protein [Microbispora corallina]